MKKIKDLSENELKEHGYESKNKMIESHKVYYGDRVNNDSELKIISFDFKKGPLLVFEEN